MSPRRRPRRVKVGDEFNRRPGEVIELEAGRHAITRGSPGNFMPGQQRFIFKKTSELAPRKIAFELDPATVGSHRH